MVRETPKLDPNRSPVHSREGKNFKIAWARDFREMLRAHPGIIKATIGLTDKAVADYNPGEVRIGEGPIVRYDIERGKWLYNREKYVMKDGKIALDEKGGAITEPGEWIPMDFNRGVILAPGQPVKDETSGLEVTVLGRSNREMQVGWFYNIKRFDKCDYIKIDFEGRSYFVKRSFITMNSGFVEFKNVTAAKEILKDLDFVKVVDAQLGYQNQQESWYVSGWEDLEAAGFVPYQDGYGLWYANDYGKDTGIPDSVEGSFLGFENEEAYNESQKKYKLIEEKLEPYGLGHDLGANLFYNPKTGTFIFLDVTGENPEMLGEAIKKEK